MFNERDLSIFYESVKRQCKFTQSSGRYRHSIVILIYDKINESAVIHLLSG